MCDTTIDIDTYCTPCVWDESKCESMFDLACEFLTKEQCDNVRKTCSYMPHCEAPGTRDVCKKCGNEPFTCAFKHTKVIATDHVRHGQQSQCPKYALKSDCEADGGTYCWPESVLSNFTLV